LIPHFKQRELAYGRKTYNARSETVEKLPSFRDAWRRGQRRIVPAEAIFEPRYFGTVDHPGKSERWRIGQDGDVPLGIAGIYTSWRDPEGVERHSFAMLTVNADGHPVFGLMHKPGEEKRMVIILAPSDYDDWLACSVAEAPRYSRQWLGPLVIEAAPLARAPRAISGKLIQPPAPPKVDPETDELF
jgi:putative SOS response-associated peptidase YedK